MATLHGRTAFNRNRVRAAIAAKVCCGPMEGRPDVKEGPLSGPRARWGSELAEAGSSIVRRGSNRSVSYGPRPQDGPARVVPSLYAGPANVPFALLLLKLGSGRPRAMDTASRYGFVFSGGTFGTILMPSPRPISTVLGGVCMPPVGAAHRRMPNCQSPPSVAPRHAGAPPVQLNMFEKLTRRASHGQPDVSTPDHRRSREAVR